jgi:hypothetical protein
MFGGLFILRSRNSKSTTSGHSQRQNRTFRLFAAALAITALTIMLVSCGSNDEPAADPTSSSTTTSPISSGSPTPTSATGGGTPIPDTPTPTPAPVAALYAGYDLDFGEGTFWRFKWEYTDRTCAQGSGCKTSGDEGTFQISLGEPKEWEGITVYRVIALGDSGYYDDPTTRSFVPEWDYLGVDGNRIVATNATAGSPLVTLFDGQIGKWAGSGFFQGRFPDDTLVEASAGQISSNHELAEWGGVEPGSMHRVGAASSQGKCETIEGLKICPREEAFAYSESEYYRPGVGPLGYEYRYSASFDGGGFSTSFSTEEKIALIASSFLGDQTGDFGTPTPVSPTPTAVPTATPVVLGAPVYGPVSGDLSLTLEDGQIPEFGSGVLLDVGVADVVFENPDVTGKWSHGITFRKSGEETFHAVFINSDGEWGHFARGGSLGSQVVLELGEHSFDRSNGGQNRVTVWFGVVNGEDRGILQINDVDVAILDISFAGAEAAGDVSVMSGMFPSDEFNGSTTRFYNFTIYEKP